MNPDRIAGPQAASAAPPGAVAVLCGRSSSLREAAAAELESLGYRVAVAADDEEGEALIAGVTARHGRIDALVNLFFPDPEATPEELGRYPWKLLSRGVAAGKAMATSGSPGVILNQCFHPTVFSGTKLGRVMPVLTNSIVGVTRSLCLSLGPQGIRVNCVQSGLVEAVELRALVASRLQVTKPPIGRWATTAEVATLIGFLSLNSGYLTGQVVTFDGGLTAGIR